MEQYADVVIDLEGNAIQGATVQIFAGAPNAWLQKDFTTPAKLYDSNGTAQDAVVTDARGAFAFQAPNGKYVLQVKVRGTIYATIGPRLFYDPADDDDRLTAAELAAPSGAALVGTPQGILSTVLALFSKVADLAASSGAALIGYGSRTTAAKLAETVSAGDYNALGGTNQTAKFNDAFSNMALGGRLNLAPVTYELNAAYNERVEITGVKGTVLRAAAGASRVMSLGRHLPDWNYHGVSGLTFDGNAKAAYGIDFNDNDSTAPEFGGRWVFDRVSFVSATTGVYAKTGNIGNTYRNCHFRGNDYGVRLTTEGSAGKMHAGCSIFEVAEFSSNAKAAIYANDNVDGGGQYDFNNVIAEGNPGFAVFMDMNNITPYAGITFRNFWEELNATAGSVNIDGTDYAPRAIFIRNTRPVVFEGSYLKDVKLVNSTLLARHCRIDGASNAGLKLDVDADSMLIVDDLYANGSQSGVPFVRSILSQVGSNATSNYSVRGPFKTWRTSPNGTILLKQNYDGAGPWSFSGTGTVQATSVSDGVISPTCAELVIPAGYSLLNPATFTPTTGKWVVWGCHFKLQAGTALSQCAFTNNSMLGVIYQRAVGEWVCTYGIQKIGTTFGSVTTYFTNSSGSSTTIRLADVFAVQFDTMEQAYTFVNSGAAIR